MKKILAGLLILMMSVSPALATEQWRNGTGENSILGTENASDIDSASYNNIVAPLDNLLGAFRRGARLTYASASTLTVESGSVVCSNSDGSVRLFARNTSSTTVAWTDIDTGSEATSTTYYVYADMAAVSNTTFGITISTSSTAPSGATYYLRLGSFYNDASGNITNIVNDDFKLRSYDSGWFAASAGTTYTKTHNLGTTKVLPIVMLSNTSDGSGIVCYPLGQHFDSANAGRGTNITALTATTISVYGINYLGRIYASATITDMASGYLRILLIALE